jgi:AraC-like DNA-binding protein
MRHEKNNFDIDRSLADDDCPEPDARRIMRASGGLTEERRLRGGAQHNLRPAGGSTVVICLEGVGTALVARDTYLARSGLIVILRGNASAEYVAGPQGLRFVSLHWPERSLAALGPLRAGLDRTRVLHGRSSVQFAWRISAELRMKDALGPWAVDVMANGIAVGLTRGARTHGAAAPVAVRARKAIQQAGYAAISMAGIARIIGCTPEHLSRTFRASYGMTPVRFAMWRRIERGRRLLSGSRMPIGAIAAELGFQDASHFARHFRAWLGMPPGRFRSGSADGGVED